MANQYAGHGSHGEAVSSTCIIKSSESGVKALGAINWYYSDEMKRQRDTETQRHRDGETERRRNDVVSTPLNPSVSPSRRPPVPPTSSDLTWWRAIAMIWKKIFEEDVFGRAAQLAYYWLFSIFPL